MVMCNHFWSTPQHAMDVIGLSPDAQGHIFTLLAGVLHLGNISFAELNNYAVPEDDGCWL